MAAISQDDALSYGWTGPCLRSTGLAYDVRKARPYLVYDRLDFEVPTGEAGDNYDRYAVRMAEMEQSLRLVEQCLGWLARDGGPPPPAAAEVLTPAEAIRAARRMKPQGRIRLSPNLEGSERERQAGLYARSPGFVPPAKEDAYTTMAGLISHFQFFMKGRGPRPPRGEVYVSVEGGNGELGYYIVSDGSDRPFRLHLRAPCFHIVAALEELIRDRLLADIIPTFGSMNMIGGELDR